jgi:hypothetical protein
MMTESSIELMQRLAARTRVGYSFEQEFYTSEAVFKADFEQVIAKKWIVAGHVSRIPTKGDYFLFRIGAEQIIVIRENEDSDLFRGKRQCTAAGLPLSRLDLWPRWAAARRAADAG